MHWQLESASSIFSNASWLIVLAGVGKGATCTRHNGPGRIQPSVRAKILEGAFCIER